MTNDDESTAHEIESAFKDFLAERAAAGVGLARSVASIRYEHRTVSIILDPAIAGVTTAALRDTSAFENVADFMGAVIAFDDELGLRLRPHVDQVVTRLADGTDLGSRTSAELHRAATGR